MRRAPRVRGKSKLVFVNRLTPPVGDCIREVPGLGGRIALANTVRRGFCVSEDPYEVNADSQDIRAARRRAGLECPLIECPRRQSDRNGVPLMNQTWGLTRDMVRKAPEIRRAAFAAARKTFDPHERLLNPYFRDLLS